MLLSSIIFFLKKKSSIILTKIYCKYNNMILIHFLKDPINECLKLLVNVEGFVFFFFGDNINRRHKKLRRKEWEDKTYNVEFFNETSFWKSHII